MPKFIIFEESYVPEPMTGCWLWTRFLTKNGYAQIYYEGKRQYAHRVSWQMYKGKIGDGKHILHRCDMPCCVNPDHLFEGTHIDNMADMMAKGRHHGPIGEKMWTAKLTEAKVRDIWSLRPNGRAPYGLLESVASVYGVRVQSISLIWRGKTWKHVTGGVPSVT